MPNNFPRAVGEQAALALVDKNVRVSIIRLPPTVHGAGDQGFMKHIVDTARSTSYSGYVSDGTNRWPAVHVHDAARLYRLALEKAPAGRSYTALLKKGFLSEISRSSLVKGSGAK